MINSNWVIVGVVIQIIGSWSYFSETLSGKIKANKVTWLLWSLAPIIAFFAQIKQGVGIISLSTLVVGLIPIIIFFASFINKDAEWKLERVDLICGIVSITGLILWMVTRVGNVAILFSIIADGMAAVPTIIKSYKFPETESAPIFSTGIINAGLAILTIKEWSFQNYAFPLYLLIVNVIITLLISLKLGVNIKRPS